MLLNNNDVDGATCRYSGPIPASRYVIVAVARRVTMLSYLIASRAKIGRGGRTFSGYQADAMLG